MYWKRNISNYHMIYQVPCQKIALKMKCYGDLKKMFELYKADRDFVMVFDYVWEICLILK